MPEYPVHAYDVLVVGSGGAGLRAAIEASAAGVSVGLVCKSLLGKAHTVMAEGGIAAALGNVDQRDNWKVHFSDTMRGGQYVNNWRMAELHARGSAPIGCAVEAWGAVFDRTAGGAESCKEISAGTPLSAAGPCVGDRTGLELIRTRCRIMAYIKAWKCTWNARLRNVALLKDGPRISGLVHWRTTAIADDSRFSTAARRWCCVPAASARRTKLPATVGTAPATDMAWPIEARRRTGGHGVCPISSHGNGLAAQRARHAGDGRRARRRRCVA